jgi:hypothetical protein
MPKRRERVDPLRKPGALAKAARIGAVAGDFVRRFAPAPRNLLTSLPKAIQANRKGWYLAPVATTSPRSAS